MIEHLTLIDAQKDGKFQAQASGSGLMLYQGIIMLDDEIFAFQGFEEKILKMPDGREVTFLLTPKIANLTDVELAKFEGINKNIIDSIEISKKRIFELCSEGGIFEEKMKNYMRNHLFIFVKNDPNNFSKEFGKKFKDISVIDFVQKLYVDSVCVDIKGNDIAFDYMYSFEINNDLWVVHCDLDMNFTNMCVES